MRFKVRGLRFKDPGLRFTGAGKRGQVRRVCPEPRPSCPEPGPSSLIPCTTHGGCHSERSEEPPHFALTRPRLPHFSHLPPSNLEPRISNLESGLTLIELIITVAIVGILATAALPMAKFQVKRQQERELRRDLWAMRDAIDRYKDAADRGAIQLKADSAGYPPDLQTLVDGVNVQEKKVRFLRSIPADPMTRSPDWGLRSNQDDADAESWGGQNVFDVYSKSSGTALDGTKYSTW